jgi:simple sugar transport system permease protein
LEKTVFGYELKATGYNSFASTYAGMNGKRNIILTMAIAGAAAGLGGAFAILAPSTIPSSSMTYEPINVIAANGFNGIAVALLGNSSPIGIIFSAVFISHIQRGGTLVSLFGFKPEIIDVVIAVIIYFSAFSMMMNTMVVKFLKNRRGKQVETIAATIPDTDEELTQITVSNSDEKLPDTDEIALDDKKEEA